MDIRPGIEIMMKNYGLAYTQKKKRKEKTYASSSNFNFCQS